MEQKSFYFKNLPLGETFDLDCIIYRVEVATDMCEGCHFWFPDEQLCMDTHRRTPNCSHSLRNDSRDVIFVKVGEL